MYKPDPKLIAKIIFFKVKRNYSKKVFDSFLEYFSKLEEQYKNNEFDNDVGCVVSHDCSTHGCYMYSLCGLKQKKG